MDNLFLNRNKCKEHFRQREVFVFGTGIDAEQLQKTISEDVAIAAYIDNNRAGENRLFLGKCIYNLEQALERRDKNQPIIVATYRFAKEICKQLEEAGLLPRNDFYVWDDMQLFHYDDNTTRYINFLKEVWGSYKKDHDERKILVMFDNKHDLLSTIVAYCSNYFAEKYDASIYGYFRFGSRTSNASEVIKSIYNAFNVKDIIDPQLSTEQQKEADDICDGIWNGLSTWEDWNNISVYGIHFGTTIVRDFLRTQIPSFDLNNNKMYSFLKKSIQTIVFWHHYFEKNDIKAVLLGDGVSWDGYIRDIAVTKGIPTYAVAYKMAKMFLDFYDGSPYPYFKEMWNQLTPDEQASGIEWSKRQIAKRLQGGIEEVGPNEKNRFPFSEKIGNKRVLEENGKLKVVICPHIFEEDCYCCGEQLFDNNYFAWLCHLGELSEKTPHFDWYLKVHPSAQRRDVIIFDSLLERYPQIKRIQSNVSPLQLKEEGVRFALTVYGTLGHEYPEIGIQVINAGKNPHSAFDFTWNPRTKEEYDYLILHLDQLEDKTDTEGLYQFYCLKYRYYDWNYIPYRSLFFDNPLLAMSRIELQSIGKELGTWKYSEYMQEWTQEKHEKILSSLDDIFHKLDEWKPNVLYKKQD